MSNETLTACILLPMMLLMLYGCETPRNTVQTISDGSRTIISQEKRQEINKDPRLKEYYNTFVVWGNHAGAATAAINWLQKYGKVTVVERARLDQLFEEQKIVLTHSADDYGAILKVGKLAGAGYVLFVEATNRSELVSGAFVGPYGGGSHSNTVHHMSVSIRAVEVETGIVRLSGQSITNQPITHPEWALPMLTLAALGRAHCPVDKEWEWIEYGVRPDSTWGCVKKGDLPTQGGTTGGSFD